MVVERKISMTIDQNGTSTIHLSCTTPQREQLLLLSREVTGRLKNKKGDEWLPGNMEKKRRISQQERERVCGTQIKQEKKLSLVSTCETKREITNPNKFASL